MALLTDPPARSVRLNVNRFGRQEAAGQGLFSEIAEAVMADIPVVVPVAKALRPDWEAFIGGDSVHRGRQ